MKQITIMALHLGYGGIERAIASLVKSLGTAYKLKIVCVYKLYEQPVFEMPEFVEIVYLLDSKYVPNRDKIKAAIKKYNLFLLIKELYFALVVLYLKQKSMVDYIKKDSSDIIISTRDIHNKILGKYGKRNTLKIAWEHNHHNNDKKYIRKVVSSVKAVDAFVLVSQSLTDFYQKQTQTPCYFIPNMLDTFKESHNKLEGNTLISVGRMSPEKGFLDLLTVAGILKKRLDFHLDIIGDGPEFNVVQQQVQQLNLQNQVTLHGFQERAYIDALLEKSTLYVMPSHSESFGIVLLEAFSHKLPCIAFDSAVGATEIIDDGINGYLISQRNMQEMADKIEYLLTDEKQRIKLGTCAYEKSFQYLSDHVVKKWVNLFEKR